MFEKAKRVRRHFKVALFGRWKTGKSRAALSFPAPAVVDTHRGTDLYDQKYDFLVEHVSKWTELGSRVDWIRKNAVRDGVETLVIDDVSNLYDDLVNEVATWRQNKSGSNAPLSQGDWGVIKRRWKAFLQGLLALDLNVVLVIREKEEYVETKDSDGKEVRRKTGNFLMDADRQTGYLFDFILYMYTEDDRKAKKSKHLVRIEGTRHERLPLFSVHDITGKFMYPELFEPIRGEVDQGDAAPQDTSVEKAPEDPADADLPDNPPPEVEHDAISDIRGFFGAVPIGADQPEATLEDIQVLFTRAVDMTWPDDDRKCRRQFCKAKGHKHAPFAGGDGKALVHGLYGVESSKELRKPQIDFLYAEFGKVLSGVAFLDRDEHAVPYVATPGGTNEEEVKAKVLEYK